MLPGRILSPVEEDKNAAPAGAPAAAPAAAAAQPLAAVAAAVAAAFVPPAAEHQAQQQQWVQGHGMLQDAHMTDAPELQVEGPIICSVGDVGMDAGDDAADGDVMSTSESDRAYGDADADTGPALILHSDAEGGIVHGGDQEEGRVADEEGQWPLVPDEFIEVCVCVSIFLLSLNDALSDRDIYRSGVSNEPERKNTTVPTTVCTDQSQTRPAGIQF